MAFLRLSNLLFKKNLLINLFFILLIIPLIQSLEFRFPTALTLDNKKIFVIHSLGIDICDSSYTTSTKILEFEDELSKSDLNKIYILLVKLFY